MRQFHINNRTITQYSKPFIIAEIGNNHNGSVELCKSLIKRAKENGADAVKLQKRCPEKLFTKKLFNSPYPGENSFGPTYGLHRKELEFDKEEWFELFDFAEKIGIMLFSTAFDAESVDFLEQFDPPAYKIASGCLRDTPLISKIADLGKPMVVSTGGGSWDDTNRVYRLLSAKNAEFCFLHCIASYPNRAEDMNLRIIPAMMERYPDIIIGLSDHYQGFNMALAAYCMGAMVFEKHFTGDHTLPGPDHALSLEPHELGEWVHETERLRAAMGTDQKDYFDCERKGIYKMGKGIWPTGTIPAGKMIEMADIAIRSPEEGLPPYFLKQVVGKIAIRELSTENAIKWEDLA